MTSPANPQPVEPGPMVRVDLHCHSEASRDCTTPLAAFPARCAQRAIRVQAITDHNEIWGAQQLQALVRDSGFERDLTVIVGEEVSTKEGEIVGLFLQEKIPAGLTPEETVSEIKAQGGLVLLPHGFDPLKRHRLKRPAIERVADSIDIVETFNARISRPRWNRAAEEWARARGLALSGGSDAHTILQIGDAWAEIPERDIRTPQDLLSALQAGSVMGEWTHPVRAFAYKQYVQLKERMLGQTYGQKKRK